MSPCRRGNVFTLVGTFFHRQSKPSELLYKPNSISHTSVHNCMCVRVSVFVCLLQSFFISSKEKREMSVDNIKQTKRGKNENHWVLCSSFCAPTERSLATAELLHAPPPHAHTHKCSLSLSLVVMDNWVTWSSLCWPAGPLPSIDWVSLTPPQTPPTLPQWAIAVF